jgi:hypothetical protein
MKKLLTGLVSIVGIYYIGKITKDIIDELTVESTIDRGIRGAGESMGFDCDESDEDDIYENN